MLRKVRDLMRGPVVTVKRDATFKDVARLMSGGRAGTIPVVNEGGVILGVVSEADLILKDDRSVLEPWLLARADRREARRKARATLAGDLMTSPPVVIDEDASVGLAARLMRDHRIKRLPVCDAAGRVVGMISQAHLVAEFVRDDDEIREDANQVLREESLPPDAVRAIVDDGVLTIEGTVERRSQVPVLLSRLRDVAGVVALDGERLGWTEDDGWVAMGPIPWVGM